MPQWLEFGLSFSATGIAIVFIALAIISLAISLIRRMDDKWQLRERRESEQAYEKDPTIDDLTLVLISAAAATMIKGRFYIRRVTRLLPSDTAMGPWSRQGRAVLHGSHVLSRKVR